MFEQPRPRSRAASWLRRPRNRHVRLKSKGFLSLSRSAATAVAAPVKRHARGVLLVIVTALVAALLGGGSVLITRASHFAITTITFSPTKSVSEDSLRHRVANVFGTNLFRVDSVAIEQALLREAWIAEAHVRFELPATLHIDLVERTAAGIVALESLYLVDNSGALFKRATPDEAIGLPVITGLTRDQFTREQLRASQQIRDALALYSRWQIGARPHAGEVHIDRSAGYSLFTDDGVGIRVGLGISDMNLDERLRRVDAVLAELTRRGEQAKMIYADNRSRPDRISVRLRGAAATGESVSEKAS